MVKKKLLPDEISSRIFIDKFSESFDLLTSMLIPKASFVGMLGMTAPRRGSFVASCVAP